MMTRLKLLNIMGMARVIISDEILLSNLLNFIFYEKLILGDFTYC